MPKTLLFVGFLYDFTKRFASNPETSVFPRKILSDDACIMFRTWPYSLFFVGIPYDFTKSFGSH